jgi:CelD/BcsL family acetyltransferase involved in cellulose biosynthesis
MRSTLAAQMGLQAELLDSAPALEPHRLAWDALAIARGRPYCAPGWMLSWLRAVAPADALLRACVVLDGDALVGIAPFWTLAEGGGRYGLLAERASSPIEPLAVSGREEEVATAVADLLGGARPRPQAIEFQGAPGGSPWPRLLAERWPGASPASITRTRVEPLPRVTLRHASPEAWLAGRSRNFRHQMRRGRRQLEEAGAEFRLSTPAELDRDIESLARLHHARWNAKGGSRALDASVESMLKLAGRELGRTRFRLLSIEVGGRSISSHLFVVAGTVRAYWLGGFDEAWGASWPSMQVLVAAVADGIEHGGERLELGPGGQDYKYRLADAEAELEWLTVASAGG